MLSRICSRLLLTNLLLAQDAKSIFAARCSVCHLADARGSERGPNLVNSRKLRSKTIEEIRGVIRNGVARSGGIRELDGFPRSGASTFSRGEDDPDECTDDNSGKSSRLPCYFVSKVRPDDHPDQPD